MEVHQRPGLLKLSRSCGHEGGDTASSSKSISVGSKVLCVAKFAKYFAVWRVAAADGVERLLTFKTDETFLNINRYYHL